MSRSGDPSRGVCKVKLGQVTKAVLAEGNGLASHRLTNEWHHEEFQKSRRPILEDKREIHNFANMGPLFIRSKRLDCESLFSLRLKRKFPRYLLCNM